MYIPMVMSNGLQEKRVARHIVGKVHFLFYLKQDVLPLIDKAGNGVIQFLINGIITDISLKSIPR